MVAPKVHWHLEALAGVRGDHSWSQKWHAKLPQTRQLRRLVPAPASLPPVLSSLSALDLSVPGRWAENGGEGKEGEKMVFIFLNASVEGSSRLFLILVSVLSGMDCDSSLLRI